MKRAIIAVTLSAIVSLIIPGCQNRAGGTTPFESFVSLAALNFNAQAVTTTSPSSGLSNSGQEFMLAFLPNYLELGTDSLELHLTANQVTSVSIEYPTDSPTFTANVALNPGEVTIVKLPATVSRSWTGGAVTNNTVRAYGDQEFIAYLVNRAPYTSDAALGLSIDTMNTEYIIMDMESDYSFGRSEAIVYAGYDNTSVTITPSNNLLSGQAAAVPFTVLLNRGEGILLETEARSTSAGTLAGSIVEADRPVGMVNGNYCAHIGNQGYCDHLFETAHPVQTWGDDILVANLPQRSGGSMYRILASQDGTNVALDGTFIRTINRGEYFDTGKLTGNHEFSADQPIFAAQFMTGEPEGTGELGDPAMGNMIPYAQYLSDYTFSTVGGNQFAYNYVTIIAENSDVGTLTLDDVAIGAGEYTPINGTDFSVAIVPISDGTHTTSSIGVHGITVEGYNAYDSYLYPGGAQLQFINPVGDENPPIVAMTPLDGSIAGVDVVATDNRPSEDANGNGILDNGEDLNGNDLIDEDTGIYFVELSSDASNLNLTLTPFVPGDGEVHFTVELINPDLEGVGSITVTDGSGNSTVTPVTVAPAKIEAGIDIEPHHCENYLVVSRHHRKHERHHGSGHHEYDHDGKGKMLPVAILGSQELNVSDIDPATVELIGVGANQRHIKIRDLRLAVPFQGRKREHCHAGNRDGFDDLILQFPADDLIDALGGSEALHHGQQISLALAGKLRNGQGVTGSDTITIKKEGHRHRHHFAEHEKRSKVDHGDQDHHGNRGDKKNGKSMSSQPASRRIWTEPLLTRKKD